MKTTYSADNVDDWCLICFVLVGEAVLLGDQAPQFIQVNSWRPCSVLENAVCSHTDFTEVTWMAKDEEKVKLSIIFLIGLYILYQSNLYQFILWQLNTKVEFKIVYNVLISLTLNNNFK